jgi:nicotinamidase-related amidase
MASNIRLKHDGCCLLVIDVQTKLLPHVVDHEFVVAATDTLIAAAALFKLPVVATVQYVKGLGPMQERLAKALAEHAIEPIEKAAFSVCGDEACRSAVEATGRSHVIVAGIEAHVCVQQTVLDLLEMGLTPVVCVDAVGSRHELDMDVAVSRMQSAGAVLSTCEALLFELCDVSGTPEFKKVLELVKALDAFREFE